MKQLTQVNVLDLDQLENTFIWLQDISKELKFTDPAKSKRILAHTTNGLQIIRKYIENTNKF